MIFEEDGARLPFITDLIGYLAARAAQKDIDVTVTPPDDERQCLATYVDLHHLVGDVPGAAELATVDPKLLNTRLWVVRPASFKKRAQVYARPKLSLLPYAYEHPTKHFVGFKIHSRMLTEESTWVVDRLKGITTHDINVNPQHTFSLPFCEVDGEDEAVADFKTRVLPGEVHDIRIPKILYLHSAASYNLEMQRQRQGHEPSA
jgi:hypothetical protein